MMRLDKEQTLILIWSMAAIAMTVAVLVGAWMGLPPQWAGIDGAPPLAEQIGRAHV